MVALAVVPRQQTNGCLGCTARETNDCIGNAAKAPQPMAALAALQSAPTQPAGWALGTVSTLTPAQKLASRRSATDLASHLGQQTPGPLPRTPPSSHQAPKLPRSPPGSSEAMQNALPCNTPGHPRPPQAPKASQKRPWPPRTPTGNLGSSKHHCPLVDRPRNTTFPNRPAGYLGE